MEQIRGAHIHITGVVQGVGFRPFVYGLAIRLGLTGWVRNTSAGVDIELDGPLDKIASFREALQREAPPMARIDDIQVEEIPPNGFTEFRIVRSQALKEAFQPISPDVSICADCERELFDPHDRRHRYPFINCTNCGPRFTIITDIPYDRPNTTMAPFEMCPACSQEYHNPLNRRFHAQPIACPECGPKVWFEFVGQRVAEAEQAIQQARRLLQEGGILAVKGLGGFHLACDATRLDAVRELRRRKLRVDKAFAIMFADMETVERHCLLNDDERRLLQSQEKPIVIVPRREDSSIAIEVAPGQGTLGVMLPYTPLHMLLMEKAGGFPPALVMTSGNLSEEPIATENEEASARLKNLADGFLMHDRDIHTRCDDSVMRAFKNETYPLRRSRGYAPYPVHLKREAIPLLAVGGELKNTFCLTRGQYAFLSHHIGDLENYETLRSFEDGIAHLERLFRIRPQALAYDLHPNYLATRYALERASHDDIPAVGVQHHHAHIASCMAEHGLKGDSPVIGIAFDGTGYGDDGAIWGGEVMLADYHSYERLFHLSYSPLPGGDRAIKEPWRLALAWLHQIEPDCLEDPALSGILNHEGYQVVMQQIERGINTPMTSSVGRLFDAVAALCGVRYKVNYEAQAAIEFEALVDTEEEGVYTFEIVEDEIDPRPAIASLVSDLVHGFALPRIAARFHNGIALVVVDACKDIRERSGVSEVVLSGGVWQNMVLLSRTVSNLRREDFAVYLHRKVPTNDGGIALGQALIALAHMREG